MGERRGFAKGAGCLASVGLIGGLGIVGMLVLTGVGGWVAYRGITSQWEGALRDTLAQATGDEIRFRRMSIGLRSVSVHDLVVRDRLDGQLLRVAQLSLQGDPRELLGRPSSWHLDGLHLEGVELAPQRDGDGFALPDTTLALLRGEHPLPAAVELPKLVIPEVTIDGLRVALDGHALDADSVRVAEGATVVPPTGDRPVVLTLGSAEVRGVAIPQTPLHADVLRLALAHDLTPDTTRWVVEDVALEGVGLTLDGLTASAQQVQAESDVVLDLLAGPSLALGTLQSDGFSLLAGNRFHGGGLHARLDTPVTLADDGLVLDELVVTELRSEATRAGWPVLDVLLAATSDARLPSVRAPRVLFRGASVGAGEAEASAARTTTSVTFTPGERLAWGPGLVEDLRIALDGSDQLVAEEVDVSGGAIVRGGSGLAFDRLALRGARGTSTWTGDTFGLPNELLGLARIPGGMRFREVEVEGLDLDVTGRSGRFPVHLDQAHVSSLALTSEAVSLDSLSADGLRMEESDLVATVRHVAFEAGEAITLVPGQELMWSAVDVRGLGLDGGSAALSIEQLEAPAGRLAPDADTLRMDTLTVRGLTGSIAWGAHAFGIPQGVFRMGGFTGGLQVGQAQMETVDLRVKGQTGSVPVHVDRVVANDLSTTVEGWQVSSGTLSGVDAQWERVRAIAPTMTLGADGTVRVEGAEAWTRLNDQRQLDLPPVAVDHAPVWLGGQFRGTEPYFGVAFPGSPYAPKAVVAPDLVLHLSDEGIAEPPTDWDLPLALTLGPHDGQGHLPVSVEGTFAGGKLAVEGHVEPAGVIQADVGVRGLVLGEMGMYLDQPMSRFHMKIQQGRGGAALRVHLEGSQVSLRGTGSARSLKLQGSPLAGVANSGFRAVKGGDNTVSIPMAIDGDLSDPAFSPFDRLLSSYVGGLHKSVAKSLGKAVKTIGGPEDGTVRAKQTGGGRNVDKAFGAIKGALKRDDQAKEEPADEATPPTKLLDTAADTGRPEAVDTGKGE